MITDVTQLVGRDVYVEKDSKYHQRLRNLNDEIGGGINIVAVDRDTLIAEDLIDMVSAGKIPLTVVDSDIAGINSTYYSNIDVSLPVSLEQRASWRWRPIGRGLPTRSTPGSPEPSRRRRRRSCSSAISS